MGTRAVLRIVLAVVIAAVVLFASSSLTRAPDSTTDGNHVISLQAPPFLSEAKAEEISAASTVESEAGMSAYLNAGMAINLASVRSIYRVIETETADYIIGSVPVAGYPESEDLHAYVHRNGWILVYYLADSPVGRIFDWVAYNNSGRVSISTRLENTLAAVASQAGVPFSGATYYDFRYPNATHLMLIVEWTTYSVGDSFQVKLPASYAYYERSWSAAQASWKLNGALVGACINLYGSACQGTLAAGQLPPDQFQTIATDPYYSSYGYAGLTLVYRVP